MLGNYLSKLFGDGWKTKLGGFIYFFAPIAFTAAGHPEHIPVAQGLGTALMGVGVAHKIEKAGK